MTQVAIMKDGLGLPGITRASYARTAEEVVVRNRTRATGLLVLPMPFS